MNYTDAVLKLGKRDSKKLGNNTYLVRQGNSFGVRLHNTIVVTIHPDNTYTLNSGGWRTVTTKARINEYCPVRVYQNKQNWYAGHGEPFYDGMTVGEVNGEPVCYVK